MPAPAVWWGPPKLTRGRVLFVLKRRRRLPIPSQSRRRASRPPIIPRSSWAGPLASDVYVAGQCGDNGKDERPSVILLIDQRDVK